MGGLGNAFYSILIQQINRHFPVRKIKAPPTDNPRMAANVKRLILKRHKAYTKSLALPLYGNYRNRVTRAIRMAKDLYATSRPTQELWYGATRQLSCISTYKASNISVPNLGHLTQEDLSNTVNQHFAVTASSPPPFDRSQMPAFLPASDFAPTVNRIEAGRELSHIKISTAPGPDYLPNKIET